MNPLVELAMEQQKQARQWSNISDRLAAVAATTETLKTQFEELARAAEQAGKGEIISMTATMLMDTLRTTAGDSLIRRMEITNGR